jgi:transcriptional regulator with XRE-family HTH domain
MARKQYGSFSGALLKEHREAAGLSIAELAEKTGIVRQYILALEKGEKTAPGYDLVCKIANALAVSLDAFQT